VKEIILLAGFLGVLFSFLWLVVLGAEKLLKRRQRAGFKGGAEEVDGGGDDAARVAVIAGIMAYEEGVRGRGVDRRNRHRRKEERISWWKKSERMR